MGDEDRECFRHEQIVIRNRTRLLLLLSSLRTLSPCPQQAEDDDMEIMSALNMNGSVSRN